MSAVYWTVGEPLERLHDWSAGLYSVLTTGDPAVLIDMDARLVAYRSDWRALDGGGDRWLPLVRIRRCQMGQTLVLLVRHSGRVRYLVLPQVTLVIGFESREEFIDPGAISEGETRQ